MGCATFSAKTFALLGELCLLGIALCVIVIGASLVTYDHFLVPVFPESVSWLLVGAGLAIATIALIGCCGTCNPRRRKCSLTLAILITVAVMAICAAAAFYAFDFENAMREADANHFSEMVGGVGGLQENTFLALKAAFTTAVAECAPSVFSTAQVNMACRRNAPRDDALCAFNPNETVGLFCSQGPGREPYTLDATLTVRTAAHAYQQLDLMADYSHSVGWWISAFCMPPPDAYAHFALAALGTNGSAADLASVAAISATPSSAIPSFGECYNSDWWPSTQPARGEGLVDEGPNAGDAGDGAAAARARVYAELGRGAPIDAKMAFCICATDAHGVSDWPSPLLSLVEWMWPVKWASVLLAVFFLLVLVAQLYLCCCTRPDDRDGSPQPGRRMPDDEGPRGGGRKKRRFGRGRRQPAEVALSAV